MAQSNKSVTTGSVAAVHQLARCGAQSDHQFVHQIEHTRCHQRDLVVFRNNAVLRIVTDNVS